MLKWSSPDTDLVKAYKDRFAEVRRFGSDTALANIFLLREKYDIRVAVENGAILRYYNGSRPNRTGYGFPLACEKADFGALLGAIKQDAAERGVPFGFCLCDERQKAVIDEFCRIDWKCTDDDSDYIYKKESLASLAGKKLHRKRNHINNFMKIYDDVEFRRITPDNCGEAVNVAAKWLEERTPAPSADELAEFESIKTAAAHMDELGICGGLLYVEGGAVAMTMASAVCGPVTDVHYEKAYGEFAANGAFTVINQMFASSEDEGCEYINREEDMGIEGLRSAKESYYPAFKLKKYYGVCKC